MRSTEALHIIRPYWLLKVSHHMARGEDLRENFEKSLGRFFDLLVQAVDMGDPAWLNPILDEWVEARTSTDLESFSTSLPEMLRYIVLLTGEAGRVRLEAEDALALDTVVTPIFLGAIEYAAQREMDLQVEHMARELEEANARLERLDKSKSDFIAIAAHELKTPLTLIEGYSAMMKDHLPAGDTASAAVVLLKGMDNGTRRLREIVDDMIDVSLIDNNIMVLNFQPIWINRILAVMKDEFASTLRERKQTLEVRSFDGCEEMTFGDEERLFQSFRNLISNAIKYTPDGGEILVDGRRLPGFIEITIEDNGIGIDSEDHTRVFEKFGRLGSVSLHSSGKTKFKGGGPGLGLPITKGIIEAHGGAIWVESPGYDEESCPGSIFHVMLPLRKTPPDNNTAKLFDPLTQLDLEKAD